MALSRLIFGGAVAGLLALILLPSCVAKYQPWGKVWGRKVICNGEWMSLPPVTAEPGAYGVRVEMFEHWGECP